MKDARGNREMVPTTDAIVWAGGEDPHIPGLDEIDIVAGAGSVLEPDGGRAEPPPAARPAPREHVVIRDGSAFPCLGRS